MWAPSAVSEVVKGLVGLFGATDDIEVTLEFNPEDTSSERFLALRQAGINRLSIGAQSFQEERLQFLGRRHTPQQISECVTDARQAGFQNISIDLIHGMAGQSISDCLFDLESAMALGIEHLSFYQLTVEPNTAFGVRSRRERACWEMRPL